MKDLAAQARRPLDVTHRELVSTHPAQRWNQIADWLIDSNLQGLIRPDQRDVLRRELADIGHDWYAKVADIPDRVSDMSTRNSLDRVHLIKAMQSRGTKAGETALLKLNIHIKGAMVNWGQDGAQTDRVRRAAEDLGVPVDKLRSLLDVPGSTGSAPREGAGVPHERPKDGQGTTRRPSSPGASR